MSERLSWFSRTRTASFYLRLEFRYGDFDDIVVESSAAFKARVGAEEKPESTRIVGGYLQRATRITEREQLVRHVARTVFHTDDRLLRAFFKRIESERRRLQASVPILSV